ncbi:MAG: hypothetical protein NTY44_12925, partial [Deltaproteobacteria bacterium]|nr:hypothetical protein [Deltaproteobacteria bacterium]
LLVLFSPDSKGFVKNIRLGCNFSANCGEVENPKSEARNPNQYPMTQIQMTKTVGRWVYVLSIGAFVL